VAVLNIREKVYRERLGFTQAFLGITPFKKKQEENYFFSSSANF